MGDKKGGDELNLITAIILLLVAILNLLKTLID